MSGALFSFAAAVLFTACSHGTAQTQRSVASAPAPQPTDPAEALTVTPGGLQSIAAQVEQSHLPDSDKSAFVAMIDEHRDKPQALDGKTVHVIILEERAHRIGIKMAADERKSDAKHRAQMAGLIEVTIVRHRDEEHRIVFTLRVRNKSAKALTRFDSGLEVHDSAGARIGLAEFRTDRNIGPHQTVTFDQPVTYLRFGEDAGTMRMAQGKRKSIALGVKEIKYADGSDAGYDD